MDSREASKHKKLVQILQNSGYEISVEKLEVGDYLIEGENPILIERKRIFNLLHDVKTGHLWEQLKAMKGVEAEGVRPVILLEGSPALACKRRRWKPLSVVSILNSLLFDWKMQYIYSPSYKWVSLNLMNLTKFAGGKPRTPHRLVLKKKPKKFKEMALMVIESLPEIGPVTSRALLAEFHSLRNLFSANLTQLTKVLPQRRACMLYMLFNYIFGGEEDGDEV